MEHPKNTICLWFNGGAEEAARFYAETFPDSSVGRILRAPGPTAEQNRFTATAGRYYYEVSPSTCGERHGRWMVKGWRRSGSDRRQR